MGIAESIALAGLAVAIGGTAASGVKDSLKPHADLPHTGPGGGIQQRQRHGRQPDPGNLTVFASISGLEYLLQAGGGGNTVVSAIPGRQGGSGELVVRYPI